jgi:electron transport complex protein RnfC
MKNIKNNIKDTQIHDYLNPEFIYIPIEPGYRIEVKENQHIRKEEVLLSSEKNNIYSPISGTIIGKSNSLLLNNKQMDFLVIENDYKEEVKKPKGAKRYISDYSKKEIIELVNKYQATSINLNKKVKRILINGLDKDPYEKTRSYLINHSSDKILETIDSLMNVLGIEDALFAINNNDTDNVINLSSHIGTYPNIKLKLMPDIYPMGFKSILLRNVLSKKQIDEGVMVLNVEDVYNIYTVLKRRKPILEKLVTISGKSVDNSMVVNVKIGTSMQDIIKHVCKVNDDKYFVVVNGLISGTTLENLNTVITKDIRSIFLSPIDEQKEVACINCGLCNLKCPMHLNPKYIKEHKKADKSKCIHCGLCTYICPSKINFKPYVGGSNEE